MGAGWEPGGSRVEAGWKLGGSQFEAGWEPGVWLGFCLDLLFQGFLGWNLCLQGLLVFFSGIYPLSPAFSFFTSIAEKVYRPLDRKLWTRNL